MTEAISAAIAAKRGEPETCWRSSAGSRDRRRRGQRGAGSGDRCAGAGVGVLDDVRLHQMLAMRSRPYIDGQRPNLRHVSWFLSPANRDAFRRGDCDLVPNSFSDVPRLMRQAVAPPLVLAVCPLRITMATSRSGPTPSMWRR